jgi:hypothetical protein
MLPQDRDRFWSRVSITGPDPSICWLWTGTKHVYGLFRVNGRMKAAHRLAYEEIIGPIPAGLVLDHLCRNPICVNPLHLEPVTHQVSNRRGLSPKLASERMKARHRARTHCKHGHPFTPENTRLGRNGRKCRKCVARRSREWRQRKRGVI